MSLALLLDEDTQAKRLASLLLAAGHQVLTINAADLAGTPDDAVLEFARRQNRALLTRNCSDFLDLHRQNSDHAGILAIYQDADLAKNMSYSKIVNAIAQFQSAQLPLRGQFVVLNQWNF